MNYGEIYTHSLPLAGTMGRVHGRSFVLAVVLLLVAAVSPVRAQENQAWTPEDLKQLTLEELMDIEVTSVSRRPEKLTVSASAIQVITNEEIRRSGATSLPDALRLASNLQVAQYNASVWMISARGFNAAFSNKLLVMIDGMTVYSPLFGGVFWDVQHVLLEDIERIEVISGPGATIWGANAVNGVINIITKKARDTQGFYASVGGGTFLRRNAALRYGGKLGPNLSYRVYGMGFMRDHTYQVNGEDNTDPWRLGQAGFDLDYTPSEKNAVLIKGNVNVGTHTEHEPAQSGVDGQDILGRWTHTFSDRSNFIVQAYYSRRWRRDRPSTISLQTETYDLEFDHHFRLGERHHIIWGGGYRFVESLTLHSTQFLALLPPWRNLQLSSGFIQDEIALLDDRLRVILGTKVQHQEFSGLEVQPSARVAWSGAHYTLWGAVSRPVRAPSRMDVDYYLPAYEVPPDMPSVAGGPNFTSEKLLAYELGYRLQPAEKVSLSLATFYNRYDDLYSVDPLPNTLTFQIQNGTEGTSHGVELNGKIQVNNNWHLRGGYSYFYKDLANKPGSVYDHSDLGNDAAHRFLLHSMLDLPENFQLDFSVRYLTALPKPRIPDYFTFDARLAWLYEEWEVSVVGQNLWEKRHREFSFFIPRGIYVNVACRFRR